MTDTPATLGAYTILSELGRGGMGVVYLAKDPRLDREVAIKVLPDEVARDPERLARFEREARLLASLKHPNIGGIHGLEEADGQRFLVLEHLEGETLATRLDGGPLRVNEAIHVCKQIAAALEAAHESGIIHRDLKPGNVMITDDDEAKVLDFGLAKGDGSASSASASDISASPTITAGATAAGVILGTAAYMSPEQARGRSVDRRTDIWSFGCVLWECLTGQQLFKGETVSDTIARVLEREPDWDSLPKATPDRVRELLRRCLEKKARERLRDIGDARIELEEVVSGKTSSVSAMTAGVPVTEHKRKMLLAWVTAGLAAIIAIVMAGLTLGRPSLPEQPLTQLEVTLPEHLNFRGVEKDFSISPDGRMIAFIASDSLGNTQIYTRELGSLEVEAVPGTEDSDTPFWSPDSRNLGFFADTKLKIVSLEDGKSETLADVSSGRGATWGDDIILFAGAQGPIYKAPVDGGEVEAVTVVDTAAGETAHRFPMFLPDQKQFMYSVLPALTSRVRVQVSDLDGSKPVEILRAIGRPVYSETGHLIWQRGQRMVAQRFDPGKVELSGKPFAIGTSQQFSNMIGTPALSVSRTGTIVQWTQVWPETRLEWADPRGRTLKALDLERGKFYSAPALSPDGGHLAVTIHDSPEESSLWLVDLQRVTMTRLTSGAGKSSQAHWSADGTRILYASDRDGPTKLYVKSIDRPNEDELTIETDAQLLNPRGISADGRYILFSRTGAGTGMDLWTARIDGDAPEFRPFLNTPYEEDEATISHNGRWVAYTSDESGRPEVYVTRFPEAARKHRISTNGGNIWNWASDDSKIYFVSFDGWIMTADVNAAGETFTSSRPRRLRQLLKGAFGSVRSPGGDSLLVIRNMSTSGERTLTVITGWLSEQEDR